MIILSPNKANLVKEEKIKKRREKERLNICRWVALQALLLLFSTLQVAFSFYCLV
jgi:hypothetical protein